MEIAMTACIVGWAHSRFGKLEGETLENLIVKVATDALDHAGIGPDEVDEIVLGHFNAGFSAQDFTASLVLQADDRLRFKPATRVENACATGSAAVRQGIRAIDANAARIVLVVGAEQMTTTPGPGDRQEPAEAPPICRRTATTPAGFAGVFGKIAQAYFQRYGDQSDALAMIAAKNHKNGVDNPYAQMRKDFGYRFLPAGEREEPVRRRPAEAHRLLAGLRRCRRPCPCRYGNRAEDAPRRRLPRQRACAGFPADVEARHPVVRRLRAGLDPGAEERRRDARRPVLCRDA